MAIVSVHRIVTTQDRIVRVHAMAGEVARWFAPANVSLFMLCNQGVDLDILRLSKEMRHPTREGLDGAL